MIPSPLVAAARELLTFLETLGRPACLIGGMVVARWGEPRQTQDVDATVLADFGEELTVLGQVLQRFPSRDPRPEPRAELGRLALVTASNGVHIDLSFAGFPFEMEVLDRASDWEVEPGTRLRTCSAEDLIVYKLVAARLIDLHDVQSIVDRRQAAGLDLDRIRLWGRRFGEILDRPDLLDPFESALRKPGRIR